MIQCSPAKTRMDTVKFLAFSLLSKQTPHSSQHTILLGVVRMLLARDLEYGRECGRVGIDTVSDLVGDMLVDQYDANVLALRSKGIESCLDSRGLCLVVDYEEVLLRVRRVRDMLATLSMNMPNLQVF